MQVKLFIFYLDSGEISKPFFYFGLLFCVFPVGPLSGVYDMTFFFCYCKITVSKVDMVMSFTPLSCPISCHVIQCL